MKKFAFLSLFLFTGFSSQGVLANEAPTLFEKMLAEEFAQNINEETVDCMESHEKTRAVLEALFNEDESDFSAKYSKYLSFKKEIKELTKEYNDSLGAANNFRLRQEIKILERDWMVFGFRAELERGPLTALRRIKSFCEKDNRK